MTHEHRSFYIKTLLLILLLTAGGFVFWKLASPSAGNNILVQGNEFPVVAKALGATVKLESVNRLSNGKVKANLNISGLHSAKPDIIRFGETSLTGGSMESAKTSYLDLDASGECGASGIEMTFKTSDSSKACSISQELYLERRDRKARFNFKDVSSATLPVKQKISDVEVTIKSVKVEKLSFDVVNNWNPMDWETNPWHTLNGVSALILTIEEKLPGNNRFNARFKMTKSGEEWETNQCFWYNAALRSDFKVTKLTDSNGKSFSLFAYKYPDIPRDTGYDRFHTEVSRRTQPEKWVAKINQGMASRMITRRAVTAARNTKQVQEYYIAFLMKTMPSRFTLEIPVTLPPAPEDVVVVTFTDIPISH